MPKFSPEERKKIDDFIRANIDASPKRIAETLNAEKVAAQPVTLSDVNNTKSKLKSHGAGKRKSRGSEKVRITVVPGGEPMEKSDQAAESESFTFEGLIEKLQEVIDYAKAIKQKQKKALEASFFL